MRDALVTVLMRHLLDGSKDEAERRAAIEEIADDAVLSLWQPIAEPPPGGALVVYRPQAEAHFAIHHFDPDAGWQDAEGITHWMHLPPPPGLESVDWITSDDALSF